VTSTYQQRYQDADDGLRFQDLTYEGNFAGMEAVTDGIKGDTASNVQKPATLETGLVISVPLFVKEGEIVRVSTADGSYLGRA